jgi:hypothetical protein
MVADALVLAAEWGERRSFDWWVVRNAMRATLVIDGRNGLGFAYVDNSHMSALFAHGNTFLDLLGTGEAHTVAD